MSLKSIRSLGIIIAPVCLVLLLAMFTEAQVQKKVVFAKGKSSATYTGKLPRNYADYDAYFFRARKGQTLTVELVSTDPNAYLAVYETKELGPDEDMISSKEENPRTWSGKLPITSEYSVQIYGARSMGEHSNRTAYSIQITIH